MDEFINQCIAAQNMFRMRHHAPPLQRSEALCASARAWALNLLSMPSLRNSPDAVSGKIGENISRKRSPPPGTEDPSGTQPPDIGPQEVADQWYAEIGKHDFRFGPPDDTPPAAGSFTQMVWKSTKEVGVCKMQVEGQCIVVAHYNPPGNVFGKYLDNVEPAAAVDTEGSERQSSEKIEYIANNGNRYVVSRDTVEYFDHNGRYVRKVEETRELVGSGADKSPSSSISLVPGSVASPRPLSLEEIEKADDHTLIAVCGYSESDMVKFQREVLERHNAFRKIHNAPPLKKNNDLSMRALRLAAKLSPQSTITNSGDTYLNAPLGESIASRWGDGDYNGSDLVNQWYAESSKFKYGEEPRSVSGIGNFTQIVWRATREIGIAKFKREQVQNNVRRVRVVVVCLYYPCGNVLRGFTENVMLPRAIPTTPASPASSRPSLSLANGMSALSLNLATGSAIGMGNPRASLGGEAALLQPAPPLPQGSQSLPPPRASVSSLSQTQLQAQGFPQAPSGPAPYLGGPGPASAMYAQGGFSNMQGQPRSNAGIPRQSESATPIAARGSVSTISLNSGITSPPLARGMSQPATLAVQSFPTQSATMPVIPQAGNVATGYPGAPSAGVGRYSEPNSAALGLAPGTPSQMRAALESEGAQLAAIQALSNAVYGPQAQGITSPTPARLQGQPLILGPVPGAARMEMIGSPNLGARGPPPPLSIPPNNFNPSSLPAASS